MEFNKGHRSYYGDITPRKDRHLSSTRNSSSNNNNNNNNNSNKSDQASEDEPKKKTFKRLMNRWADKSSMTGLTYIKEASLMISRVIWAVLLTLALAAMTGHLYLLINNYYQWPKTAKIELGFANLPFPEMTICNANPMHKGRLDKYQGATELKALLDKLEPKNLVPEQFDEDLFKREYYDEYYYYYDDTPEDTDAGGDVDTPDVIDDGTGGDGTVGAGDGTNDGAGAGNDGGATDGADQGANDGTDGGATDGTDQGANDGTDGAANDGTDQGANDGTDGAANDGTNGDEGVPQKRKKRFTDEYGEFNLNEFDSEYVEEFYEEDFTYEEFEYDSPRDNQTKVNSVFQKLYMAIPNQFTLHQSSDFGNCWTISSQKFTALDSGPRSGLSIVLYLETTEYLYGITQGYGVNVQLHERGTYPDPYQEGIRIPASMETDIGLKSISITRLGQPHGNCESGEEFQTAYGRRYTRRSCQQMCRVIQTINSCGCYDEETEALGSDASPESHVCNSANETACLELVKRSFELKNMTCVCENPCSEQAYTKSVSSRQWPTEQYAFVLLDGVCNQNVNICKAIRGSDKSAIYNNFIKLNIYFEDLNYEEINEEADISQAQLLSDVGGAIGLWIGLSILSFCEYIQLLFELIDFLIYKIRRPRQKRREKRKQQSDIEGSSRKRLPGDGRSVPTRFVNSYDKFDYRNGRYN